MRRREFITALGGATVWPLAARAQQKPATIIGVLTSGGSLEANRLTFAPALRRLAEMGYVEGRNLTVEYRSDSQEEHLAAVAADLVQHRVNVIFTGGGPATSAAKGATASIPIIFFTGFDPVAAGFVASLNRPGGNVTGVAVLNMEVLIKRLEMLHELVPTAKLIAFLYGPTKTVSGIDLFVKNFQSAADTMGLKLIWVDVSRVDDFEGAFAKIEDARADALFVSADVFMLANGKPVVDLAARYKIPAVYPIRGFAVGGGLVSYGTNYPETYRLVGDYIGRVLNADKPEDLPVQQVTKLELVINMKTAKSLGLEVPLPLLGRADEVIE
jgi:putative tryptophan/tyrosine transport system substrate-binding protein